MSARRKLVHIVLLGVLLALALGATPAFGAALLADSYPESNSSTTWGLAGLTQTELGQSFTAIGGTLDSATFYLSRQLSPSGDVHALLYAHSGAFGSTGVGSGAPLATSSPVAAATLGDTPQLVTFHFDNTVSLAAGTKYVIVVRYPAGAPAGIRVGIDNVGPTHPGALTYVEAGVWRSDPIYDVIFYVYETQNLAPVYRFYNTTNGTHFYTPSTQEREHVLATWPHIYTLEGVAYSTNPANNTTPLQRLYNKRSGSHFYTPSEQEAQNALARWPDVFTYDGPTYAVNPAPVANSIPVYRFYNLKNGSHFYTASDEEKNHVIATWPHIYQYEGPAFWLGQ
jgi:hypothetical protein